ncbi:MAG: hypothetical protein E6H00_15065 [Bacillati bacterium ANGP1]|uniref:Uncharacterized protein n=1 Tax=Candidatus Segetimicrobium genomatis TaxID=2569760 RepID=A0A537JVR6_9BACT|nr:MAG: hypothetical protein E6H00_15065 [Terrabacteria group bacterium ANGP1]
MASVPLSHELKEYVRKTYEEFATADPLSTRGVIRAGTRLVENCRSEAELEGHTVICDEPKDRAGGGAGPAPLYYFLASLGF